MTAVPLVVIVLLIAMACYFFLRRKATRAPGLRTAMLIIAAASIGFLIWLALMAEKAGPALQK